MKMRLFGMDVHCNMYMYRWFRFMVFNATFNNISVISLWSVLLVEETRVSQEIYGPVTSH